MHCPKCIEIISLDKLEALPAAWRHIRQGRFCNNCFETQRGYALHLASRGHRRTRQNTDNLTIFSRATQRPQNQKTHKTRKHVKLIAKSTQLLKIVRVSFQIIQAYSQTILQIHQKKTRKNHTAKRESRTKYVKLYTGPPLRRPGPQLRRSA